MKIIGTPKSGKRGPYIYQGGRYGQTSRTLVVPLNPRTLAQCLARNRLACVASRWRQLTQPQRNAWTLAALAHQSATRLDQSGPLSGLQLFTKINCSRLIIGAAEATLPPPEPAFNPLPVTGLTITNTGGAITLKLDATGALAEVTMLRGAPPCSQGCDWPPRVVYLGTVTSPLGGAIDITALYIARHGPPPVGAKVFVQVNQNAGGWEDTPQQFAAIVPAAG